VTRPFLGDSALPTWSYRSLGPDTCASTVCSPCLGISRLRDWGGSEDVIPVRLRVGDSIERSSTTRPFTFHTSVPTTPIQNFQMAGGSKGVTVRVYIVRHGETQENRDGIIQGHRDTFLNAIGLEQARMAGEALKDAKLGIAFSSDLSRAVKKGFGFVFYRSTVW